MVAHIVILSNPFMPVDSRQVHCLESGGTIADLLSDCAIDQAQWERGSDHGLYLYGNGVALHPDSFDRHYIKDGDCLVLVRVPQGGGGGGGGSSKNPLRTVMAVAVMVGAAAFGPALGGLMGFSGVAGGALAGAVGSATIALAGNVLMNALIPAPNASAIGGSYGSISSPSPTYSLQAQGNSARLGEPIPCQYGRHRVFPDFIVAEPWSEYIDNEQYVYQAHCLGLGEFDIEQIQIADSDISNFEEISYRIVQPGGSATFFDINAFMVKEVSGQTLKAPNDRDDDGYIGPFTLNPVDTVAREIGIDIVCPQGLYYADNNGDLQERSATWEVQARLINDDNVATGSWRTLGTHTLTDNNNTAIRKSYSYTVSPGRYEVRARRTNDKDTSNRAGDAVNWAGLRAFVDGPDSFPDVTLLLLKMRATDNLSSQTARQINVIQTRKLPIWSNGVWSSPQATSSIIWALCDIARASYGAELEESRLPLADLAALDELLEERGDHFDGVFDSKTTVWEALTRTARCGRAVPLLQGGVLRVIRDTPQSLPVALFGPRNIVKGSFKIDYLMPSDDTADAVTVEYFNAVTWKPAEVTGSLADSTADAPASVTLFGCTSSAHAEREALYMAADNRYRRRIVTFRTELDGMIPTYGDLIALSHDMPNWGQGGELIAWDADTLTATLSEPLYWTDNVNHVIALRQQDGTASGPYSCVAGGSSDEVVLALAPDFTPYTGLSAERTYYAFGPADNWSQLARVIAIKPRQAGEQVEITAVVEDDRVHVN